jgi:hydrogenase-4 component B
VIGLSDIAIRIFIFIVSGYALGSLIPLLVSTKRKSRTLVTDRLSILIGYSFSLAASILGCWLSFVQISSNQVFHFLCIQTLPFGPFSFHIDQLSAFFLGVISLLGTVVSLFSFGYSRESIGKKNAGVFASLFNLFLLAMVLVVTAGNVIVFLLSWEIMSLVTFFLINYDHEEASSRRAGIRYIVMTHIGTAFLIVMFLLFTRNAGSFEFTAMSSASAQLPSALKNILFLCAIVGFGIKAGIIPLHLWLPEAHPAAPSNVSALMSGVMIKMGIYGIIRIVFDFLGTPPAWWGILLLSIAVVSAVLGVLYALMEHDLKRLLAFHSIENIGIILIGIGAAVLFSSYGNNALAALSLIAGLYHVLNHAIFKGLLFLGAGSVVQATHTKNIEELGGLAKTLPWTAGFFLVGSMAISALPPLNGFISEWLTFQALFLGFQIPDLIVRLAIPFTVALLALTSALAAACFVKAFGITFLGMPRSAHVEHAKESPPTMLIAMAFLAVACIFLGMMPGLVVAVLNPVASMVLKHQNPLPAITGWGSTTIAESTGGGVSPAVVAILLGGCILIPIVLGALIGGRLRKRNAMIWACGMKSVRPRMQYSATGFSKPIRMIFSSLYHATHEIETTDEPALYFKRQIRYELRTESIFEKYLYEPLIRITITGARVFRKIQTGHIQSYLAYIFIVLILLLIFAR